MKRRQAVIRVCETLTVSQQRACKVLGQNRSTQSHQHRISDQEEQLTRRIIELATTYGRYGYRLITGLLRNEGWKVNHKRVERIWRKEALKVPQKQPKRGRLWLNDGSCIRLRPEYKNHVWSYDFVTSRTHEVIERLADLFITRGIPDNIRSDNGPEFTAKAVRKWLGRLGVTTDLFFMILDKYATFCVTQKEA